MKRSKQYDNDVWQQFLLTGAVEDYLRYKHPVSPAEPDPKRRIQQITGKKELY